MANPTQITGTLPTANTDGTAIAGGEITGLKVVISYAADNAVQSTTPVFSTVVDVKSLNADANGNFTIPLPSTLAPGNKYSVVLFTEAVSQGVVEESAPTNSVEFAIAAPSVPNPPSALSVS